MHMRCVRGGRGGRGAAGRHGREPSPADDSPGVSNAAPTNRPSARRKPHAGPRAVAGCRVTQPAVSPRLGPPRASRSVCLSASVIRASSRSAASKLESAATAPDFAPPRSEFVESPVKSQAGSTPRGGTTASRFHAFFTRDF